MLTAAGSYEDLVKYLLMVRKKVKEPKVDSELLYAYARTNNLSEIDAFLHTSHQANLQQVGDRCARVCFWGEQEANLGALVETRQGMGASCRLACDCHVCPRVSVHAEVCEMCTSGNFTDCYPNL